MRELDRRRFVQSTGAAIAVGTLAGCTDGGGNGDGGGGNGGGDVPQAIDDHLSDANEYDGSVADRTGQDEVTVEVGAGNGLAFSPAAVRVDSGTTVVWEWTGRGDTHNVASVEGSATEFSSEIYTEAGVHFEQAFEETGVQLYVCEPHQAQGMKGAVDVV